MIVSKETLQSVHLEAAIRPYRNGFHVNPKEFFGAPGREHYRLLAYLSQNLSGKTIIDIGTHMGSSALALAVNPDVTIYSFDIHRKIPMRDLPNLNFEIADLWDPIVREHWKATVLESAMIVLDIDPHDGPMELEFINWLRSENYRGLIVCDDIWYFKGMRDNFWFQVPSSEKLDITPLGHWSGTGIISFQPRTDILWETHVGLKHIGELPGAKSPWTIVTAYFDLTKMPDASPAIKARSYNYYLDHARATLALDQPMIVFCEEDTRDALEALRPKWLLSKTKFITLDFEKLPMTKYRDTIIKNRIENPYRGDERNTASYYLLCMARYGLLKAVMDLNPFQSTHFAWLNICIERMGYQNVAHLEEVFCQPPRDKVSTVYIDYIPQSLIKNTKQYYEFGRCSLCSGFFTGDKAHLYEFCSKIEEKFLHYVHLGYGHADEQLYSPVYFENPHLFETYFGDYNQMITNYSGCYENEQITIQLLIPRSYAAKDWKTCESACRWLWESSKRGTISLKKEDTHAVLTTYMACVFELGGAELARAKTNGAVDAYYAFVTR
jgi:hypothetical protein